MRVTTARFAVIVVSLLGMTGCKMSNPFAKKDAASGTALADAPQYKPGNSAKTAGAQRPSANATASTLGHGNAGKGGMGGTGSYPGMSPNYGAPANGSSSSYPIATNSSYSQPPAGGAGANAGYQQPVTTASYDNQYPKTGYSPAQNVGTSAGSASMSNPYTQPAAGVGAGAAQVGHYDPKGYSGGTGYGTGSNQQPPAGATGGGSHQNNSANSYVTSDPYKSPAGNGAYGGTPEVRTADATKPYSGATRSDYGAGTAAGGNSNGGVNTSIGGTPAFGSGDPYLTQGDPYKSALGGDAGKSAELPASSGASTPKNDYTPGATGYKTGDTGYNAGNTGYGSGTTGYKTGDTGYKTGDTGYNVPPSYSAGANGSTPTATGGAYRPGGTSDFKPGAGVTTAPANGSWNQGPATSTSPAAGAGSYGPPAGGWGGSAPASSAPATTPNGQFGGSAGAGYGSGY